MGTSPPWYAHDTPKKTAIDDIETEVTKWLDCLKKGKTEQKTILALNLFNDRLWLLSSKAAQKSTNTTWDDPTHYWLSKWSGKSPEVAEVVVTRWLMSTEKCPTDSSRPDWRRLRCPRVGHSVCQISDADAPDLPPVSSHL